MNVLHIVPGLNDPTNGIAVAAKLIAEEQSKSGAEVEVVETQDFVHSNNRLVRQSSSDGGTFEHYSEIWVHSMWLPMTLKACWKVLKAGVPLVRMPHGCMDPVKVRYHLSRKIWFLPVEKWLFRRCDRIVSTEEAEDGWIKGFVGRRCPPIKQISLNRPAFDWSKLPPLEPVQAIKTILYIGRLHPLKGVRYLIAALPKGVKLVTIGKDEGEGAELKALAARLDAEVEFKGIVSQAEKEEAMRTCDLFVLPTLSENFGLVVAEALERGKRVITTDGAPAWEPPEAAVPSAQCLVPSADGRLIYLKGYRDGTDEERVELLKDAIRGLV